MNIVIRPRRSKKGTVSYQLDYFVNGRRKQLSFKTAAKAEAERQRLLRAARRHGEGAMALDEAELAEFVALRARCASAGATLHEAVEYFMQHGGAITLPVTVVELANQFIASREERDKSRRYVQSLRSSLGSLSRWLPPGKMAHEVTRAEMESWLRSGGWGIKTRRNHLGFAASCFAWGTRAGHLRRVPCEGIELAGQAEREIEVLPVDVCERLLNAAVTDRACGLYVILGLMTGIRRAEAQRLTWAEVRLDQGLLLLAGEKTKTRRRRVIDLSEACLAWLRAYVASCGPLAGAQRIANANLALHLGRLRVRAGVALWPHNALRHTFASMHYAHFQDEAKLQVIMGHESAAMLHRHYRAVVTSAEAGKFWALRPKMGDGRSEIGDRRWKMSKG